MSESFVQIKTKHPSLWTETRTALFSQDEDAEAEDEGEEEEEEEDGKEGPQQKRAKVG